MSVIARVTPIMALAALACGGDGRATVAGDPVPLFRHVVVVVEENASYARVADSSSMPYLKGLAQEYGLATQYYANTHPSIGNYFMMTVGKIITNDDDYSRIVTDDNIIRHLVAAGKTWKSYAEDLPSIGYIGPDSGKYARRHNVIALLSDVANDTLQAKHLVPFTQFAVDLARGALPNYSMIVPNVCNDAHDCPLATADTWLKSHIDPLVKNASFRRDGLLLIVFDEANAGDNAHGGGRIALVVVSGRAKRNYRATTLYQHESTLRLTAQALGLTTFPNAAARAPAMGDFFTP